MYPLIKTPIFSTKDFIDFTKDEAKEYFQWFLSTKDERIKILEAHAQLLYPQWKADHTKFSLIELYQWFKGQIAYRAMSDEEKQAIKVQLSTTPLLANVIPIPEATFTDTTVTICFDVGIYLGQTLIRHDESLTWTYVMKPSRYIYFAQPVIAKKEVRVHLNPRAVIEVLAGKILDNDITKPNNLEQLFNVWKEIFSK